MTSQVSLEQVWTEKIMGLVYPQLLQISGMIVLQWINTGDRMKDGILATIANTLISFSFSILYLTAVWILTQIKKRGTNILNSELILQTVSPSEIDTYEHTYMFPMYDIPLFTEWVLKSKMVDSVSAQKNKQIDYVCTRTKDGSITIGLNSLQINPVIFPVLEYYNSVKRCNQYVFFVRSKLYSQSFAHLQQVINRFESENKCLGNSVDTQLFINETNPPPSGNDSNTLMSLTTRRGTVSKRLTFDRLCFDQKTELLEWLEKFKNKNMYPDGLPLENKLGILLYGPPGTGKTGCISAVANYLNRCLLVINSIKKLTQSQLRRLMEDYKDYIIVLDEIDYMLEDMENNEGDLSVHPMLMMTDVDSRNKLMNSMIDRNNDKIDRGFLLKLLDGIGNNEGRLIIATTNNPDKINKLFLRPGRFDVILKLGFCSYNMFVNIVKTKFIQVQDLEHKSQIESVLKNNITPLILINNLVTHSTLTSLIETLGQLETQNYP